jgi:methylmalonyl-CoA mutase C-terminal domain/subunit
VAETTTGNGPVRVIMAKPGLDGHDRGARVVAQGLRDAGLEVIYTGLRRTPAQIASATQQEDADVVCLSILSGAHVAICRQLQSVFAELEIDVPVVVGGIIPEDDVPALHELGVRAVFGPGSRLADIADEVVRVARERP